MNKNWRWFFWILSALFYFYEFVLQISAGVLVDPLSVEFHLNATVIGLIGAIYFYSYAIMQIPAGVLLDRFGAKKSLSFAISLCALGSFILYAANHFYWVLFSRFLTALGSAFAFIGVLKTAENWFPSYRFPLLSGLTFMIGMLGAIFGKAPLAYIIREIGWRDLMLSAGIAGLILSIIFIFVFKEAPNSVNPYNTTDETADKKNDENQVRLKDFLPVFRNAENWKVAFYGGLMISPLLSLAGLWGEKYLMDVYSFSSIEAAGRISLLLVGFGIGAPFSGWLLGVVKSRKISMMISSVGVLLTFICIFYMDSILLQKYLFVLLGFFTAFSIVVFTLIRDLNPIQISATALGFANLLNMVIGAICQTMIGIMLDHSWEGHMKEGAHIYTNYQYQISFSILLACIVLALLIILFTKDRKSST